MRERERERKNQEKGYNCHHQPHQMLTQVHHRHHLLFSYASSPLSLSHLSKTKGWKGRDNNHNGKDVRGKTGIENNKELKSAKSIKHPVKDLNNKINKRCRKYSSSPSLMSFTHWDFGCVMLQQPNLHPHPLPSRHPSLSHSHTSRLSSLIWPSS